VQSAHEKGGVMETVAKTPDATRSFDSGTLEPVPMREQAVEKGARNGGVGSNRGQNGPAQPGQYELARRLSFTVAYDLWLSSWENGALGTRDRDPKPGA
jgi:hypothetical protein